MRDLTMCSPTKFTKRCATCYRRNAKPSRYQSYANFYDKCDDYYIKEVPIEEYNKRMNRIIASHNASQIDEALIALLDEASKYVITPSDKPITTTNSKKVARSDKSGLSERNKNMPMTKGISFKASVAKWRKRKHGQKVSKAVKRVCE